MQLMKSRIEDLRLRVVEARLESQYETTSDMGMFYGPPICGKNIHSNRTILFYFERGWGRSVAFSPIYINSVGFNHASKFPVTELYSIASFIKFLLNIYISRPPKLVKPLPK